MRLAPPDPGPSGARILDLSNLLPVTQIVNAPLDTKQARFNMIEQQIRTWEVLDQEILDLLYLVHREEFVPAHLRELAFSDLEIPIGKAPGECMWPPRLEARVLQDLALKKSDRVLEVGTGTGYLSALLAHCVNHVYSVDINPDLARLGAENLACAGIDNVSVDCGDAAQSWSRHAPYDVIILTSSTPVVPDTLLAQLAPGGRLFAIVGDAPLMSARILTCSTPGNFQRKPLFETCTAPLINALQPARFQF